MFSFIKQFMSRMRLWLIWPMVELQASVHDNILRAQWAKFIAEAKNPLNHFGAKFFSQNDEDGITLEIVRRLGITAGTFAELGVGNGLENNTLILLAKGWRGFWIGGQELAFKDNVNPKRFTFFKTWLSLENLIPIMRQGFESIGTKEVDILGLDLDGNDYYFVRELLTTGIFPKLFIVEYNSKFPPPIKWTIEYNANHTWDATDYMGASLASFCELLARYSYTLICCNAATGSNAYFVRNQYLQHFSDVPSKIDDIFIGCRYGAYKRFGHPVSPKTVERILRSDSEDQTDC